MTAVLELICSQLSMIPNWLVIFIYKTQSYHGKLPRWPTSWQIKMLNCLQVQMEITPLDLGTGRNRDYYSSCLLYCQISTHIYLVSGILTIHWCIMIFRRTVYAMCNIRSLIMNGLLWLEELDSGEIMEESLTSEYIFLVNLSVLWAFSSQSVGHGWSIKDFRNYRPWYVISWTMLSKKKQHSQTTQNLFEPIFTYRMTFSDLL